MSINVKIERKETLIKKLKPNRQSLISNSVKNSNIKKG